MLGERECDGGVEGFLKFELFENGLNFNFPANFFLKFKNRYRLKPNLKIDLEICIT